MSAMDNVRSYLDGWNNHDGEAITKAFSATGKYCDPTSKEAISPAALAEKAKQLWNAFPDLSFQISSPSHLNENKLVAEWVMRGTNSGSFMGLPPTGKTIDLPGIDIIEIGTEGIQSIRGYFDSKAIPEQLGLQVLIQPDQLGPFSFGYSSSVHSGLKTKPGAFAVTAIWNADDQVDEIRALSRDTAIDMLKMDGFIGLSLLRTGNRGVTISAWERPEQVKQLRKKGAHTEAMRRFWEEVGDAAYTSVWVPAYINPLFIRCRQCHSMSDPEQNSGVCKCGAQLPEPPPYF